MSANRCGACGGGDGDGDGNCAVDSCNEDDDGDEEDGDEEDDEDDDDDDCEDITCSVCEAAWFIICPKSSLPFARCTATCTVASLTELILPIACCFERYNND